MPQAAIPIAAEAAVASTLTAAEIAAAQAAAAELAAAQAAAAQTVAATNASVLSAIAPTAAPAAPAAATTATTAAGTGVGTGVGGIVDLGTSPEVLQQLQAVKGPLELGNAAANTYTGPGSMSNFGELVNPFETLPPAAPPVVPAAPPVVPAAPLPAAPPPPPPPAMPPPEYGFTGAPPAEPLVESAATTPVNPSNPVQATSTPLRTSGGFDTGGFENLSGIDMLAKEVSSTSAFNTAPTLTQYGAGAPTSTLPTSFNPAAPMANPTYAQSGLQGLQTNLSGPLGSNLPPPSVTQAVTSAGTGLPPASQDIGKTVLENVNNEAIKQVPPSIGSGNYPYSPISEQDKVMSEIYDRIAPQTTVSGETVYPQTIGTGAPAPEAGGIKELFNQGLDYAKKNPLTTAMFANTAYNYLNQPKPYEPKKYKPTFKPGLYTGYQPVQPTPYQPNYAHGGLADLGDYSDYARGGRMLKGPGDGMSDDIPATIAGKQPARLANEEFVVPADVVSHLGNGSSEAGAKVLYKMMDRVRQARTGNKKQGKQINPEKYLA